MIEPLEDRVLLASDLTLRFNDATSTLQLIETSSSAVVQEDVLNSPDRFEIQGTTGDDVIRVDFSSPFLHQSGVHFVGLGGDDELRFVSGAVTDLMADPGTAALPGEVSLDGSIFSHIGVETVASELSTTNASVSLDDDASATIANTSPTEVQVQVTNNGQPTNYDYTVPLDQLSVTSSSDQNTTTVDVQSTNLSGGSLHVKASTVTVADSAVVEDIDKLRLEARYVRFTSEFIVDVDLNAQFIEASVSIGENASISATKVDVTAYTEDAQFLSGATEQLSQGTQNVLNGLVLNNVTQLTNLIELPISVLIKKSKSEVTVSNGVQIQATGDLTLDSTAVATGDAEGIMWIPTTGALAFTYIEADSVAEVTISADAELTSGGDVSVTTEANTKTKARSRVFQNLGFKSSPDPNAFGFSVAVGGSSVKSHVTMDAGSSIQATGNVALKATGDDDNGNSVKATTVEYKDGKVGMTFAYFNAFADVSVKVDGSVTAGGAAVAEDQSFNPFLAVDADGDTISLPGHTFTTGDEVLYSSDLLGPIGGLVSDRLYNVIVVDDSTIQLAQSVADADSGIAIDLAALPRLLTNGQAIAFSRVDTEANAILMDFDPQIQTGDVVTYAATDGKRVGGLSDNTAYFAVVDPEDPQTIQLAVSADDANAGNVINLDAYPIFVLADGSEFPIAGIDAESATFFFDTPGPLDFLNGDAITFQGGLDVPIDGLVSGQTYYVIVPSLDPDTGDDSRYVNPDGSIDPQIRLAATPADAIASDGFSGVVLIEFSNELQTGSMHTLEVTDVSGITISATHTADDSTSTSSGIGGDPKSSDLTSTSSPLGVLNSVLNGFGQDFSFFKKNTPPQGSNVSFDVGITGSFNWLEIHNTVLAEVGGDAVLSSGADISIDASLTQSLQQSAEADSTKPKQDEPSLIVAASGSYGNITNTSQAIVRGDAQVDATGQLSVTSELSYPFVNALLTSPDKLREEFDTTTDALNTVFTAIIPSIFNFGSASFATWNIATAEAEGSNAKVDIAGVITWNDLTNTSEAIIEPGAKINQTIQNDNQSILIDASSKREMINGGGIFNIPLGLGEIGKLLFMKNKWQEYSLSGVGGAKNGAGGAFYHLNETNVTRAGIGIVATGTDPDEVSTDPTQVHSGATPDNGPDPVKIRAFKDLLSINWTGASTSASQYGVGGSFAWIIQDDTTTAQIGSGTELSSGGLTMSAEDEYFYYSFNGGAQTGANRGVGFAGSWYDLSRTTEAFIGDETSDVASTIIVTDAVDISATNSGGLYSFSLAADTANSKSDDADAGDNDINAPDAGQGGPNPDNGGAVDEELNSSDGPPIFLLDDANSASWGLGISGDFSYFDIRKNIANAYIDDVGTVSAGTLKLSASNDTKYIAAAGAVVVDSNSESGGLGLAGSVGVNSLQNEDTRTYINRLEKLTITASGLEAGDNALDLDAQQNSELFGLAVGGAGTKRPSGFELVGSLALNTLGLQTTSTIDGIELNLAGNARLSADDKITAQALAGSFEDGGKLGVGTSWAWNSLERTTATTITDSTVNQTSGSLSLTAKNSDTGELTPDLVATAITGAIAGWQGNSVALAGSVAVNLSNNTRSDRGAIASLSDTDYTNTDFDQGLDLTASDGGDYLAVSGTVAVANTVAVGFAVANNDIDNDTETFIDGGTVEMSGDLSMSATVTNTINAEAMGASTGGATASLAGSAARSATSRGVRSYIDAATMVSADDITLSALIHDVDVSAGAGNLGLSLDTNASSGKALGASIVIQWLTDTIEAYISDSTVQAGGTVTVTATSDGTDGVIVGAAIGIEDADKFSAGGSVVVANIDRTNQAYLLDTDVDATGDVVVEAEDKNSKFLTIAGIVSIAGSNNGSAFGAGVPTNFITQTTKAYVSGGLVQADGSVTVNATREDGLALTLAAGGEKADQAAVGGAVGINFISTVTEAFITAGAIVVAAANVQVKADEKKNAVVAASGNFDLSSNGSSIGAASSTNNIQKSFVKAYIGVADPQTESSDGSSVTASQGTVDVQAVRENTLVMSLAVGGAVGANAVISGSVALNDYDDDASVVDAHIAYATAVGAGGVNVQADQHAHTVVAAAGSISLTSAKQSVNPPANVPNPEAAAENVIEDQLAAVVENQNVVQDVIDALGNEIDNGLAAANDNNFALAASPLGSSESQPLGDSLGGGFAVGAASADSLFDGTQVNAYVTSSDVSSAGGDVTVQADQHGVLVTVAAAGAGGGQGASVTGAADNATATGSHQTHAYIDGQSTEKSTVTANSVAVDAKAGHTFVTVAGEAAFSEGGTSLGAAIATLIRSEETRAYVDQATINTLVGGDSISVTTAIEGQRTESPGFAGLSVTAVSDENITSIAAGTDVALDGSTVTPSVAVNVLPKDETDAHIGAGASINPDNDTNGAGANQSVNVYADSSTVSHGGAGSLGFSGSGSLGLGVSADVGTFIKTTEAFIDADTKANRNVSVQAKSTEDLLSIAATVEISSQSDLSGALGTYIVEPTTTARIGNESGSTMPTVTAGGSVIVAATDDSELDLIAGNIAGAGQTATGGSIGVDVFDKTVQSFIGPGAQVTADSAAQISAASGGYTTTYSDPTPAVTHFDGSDVGDQYIVVGSVDDPNPFTTGDRVTVEWAQSGTPDPIGNLNFDQYYFASVDVVEPGQGLDPVRVIRLAESLDDLQDTIEFTGDAINAASSSSITLGKVADGVRFSEGDIVQFSSEDESSAGIAGLTYATPYYLHLETIGDEIVGQFAASEQDLQAGNYIELQANAGTETQSYTISGEGDFITLTPPTGGSASTYTLVPGGVVSFTGADLSGGGIRVGDAGDDDQLPIASGDPVYLASVDPQMPALQLKDSDGNTIQTGTNFVAHVTTENSHLVVRLALTQSDFQDNKFVTISAASGCQSCSYVLTSGVDQRQIQPPSLGLSSGAGNSVSNPSSLAQQTDLAANYESAFQGIAVTANSTDTFRKVAGGIGIGGTNSFELAALVNVLDSSAVAYVAGQATTQTQGDVRIAASNHLTIPFSVAGGLAASGNASAMPAFGVSSLISSAEAYVDEGGVVQAADDVQVISSMKEDVTLVVATIDLAGNVADADSIATSFLTTKSHSKIKSSSMVTAGSNVQVEAEDATTFTLGLGSLALGGDAAGIGVSVGFTDIRKNTQATIDGGATVHADANGDPVDVITGELPAKVLDDLPTKSIHGVALSAQSTEDILQYSIAGAGSLSGAVAGSVIYTYLGSNTTAEVSENANVTTSGDVSVAATNQTLIDNGVGSVDFGIGGVGAGVDVGLIRNNTTARIDGTVDAGGDIDVLAVANREVKSFGLSIAAVGAGIAGSVSVWSLGAEADSTYSIPGGSMADALTVNSGTGLPEGTSFGSYLDSLLSLSDITGALDSSGGGADSSDGGMAFMQNAAMNSASVSSAQDDHEQNRSAEAEISSSDPAATGSSTEAVVGSNANIAKGTNLVVQGREQIVTDASTGGVEVAAVGVGGSVAITNVQGGALAHIDGQVAVSGDITIDAGLHGDLYAHGFVGALGFAVAAAQVAIINDHSVQQAWIEDGAEITSANSIAINADRSYSKFRTLAIEGEIAGGAYAVGASIATTKSDGSTAAYIGGATIGGTDSQNPGVGDVTIDATADYSNIRTDNYAVSVGVEAGEGNRSETEVSTEVIAGVGPQQTGSTVINLSGDLKVTPKLSANPSTYGFGVAVGGIAVGVTEAYATVDPTVSAFVGDGSTINLNLAGSPGKGGLTLESMVTANQQGSRHSSYGQASGGGAIVGDGTDVQANYTPTVSALIGDDAQIHVMDDVIVHATSTEELDVLAEGITVGGLAVAVNKAELNINPTVNASIGDNAVVDAGGGVQVEANSGETGTLPGLIFSSANVNYDDNTITFDEIHGLSTGDSIFYDPRGAAPIGGLVEGRAYKVIRVNDKTVKLGTAFSADGVSTTTSTLQFTEPHGLISGQAFVVENNGNPAIPGLEENTQYFTNKLDAATVKVAENLNDAFGLGMVHFDAPTSIDYENDWISLPVGGYARNGMVARRDNFEVSSNHTLFFSSPVPFVTGDAVQFVSTIRADDGGLESGQIYYVVVTPTKNGAGDAASNVQFARSRAAAMQASPTLVPIANASGSNPRFFYGVDVSQDRVSIGLPLTVDGFSSLLEESDALLIGFPGEPNIPFVSGDTVLVGYRDKGTTQGGLPNIGVNYGQEYFVEIDTINDAELGASVVARFALTQEKLDKREFVGLNYAYADLIDFNLTLTRTIDAFVVGDAITYRSPINPRFTSADVVTDPTSDTYIQIDDVNVLAFLDDGSEAIFTVEPLIETNSSESFDFQSSSIANDSISFDPGETLPFEDGDGVVLGTLETSLGSTTPVPTGLEFATLYFATIDNSNHTIQLSLTKGGAAVEFSSAGDGFRYTLTSAVDNAKPLSPLVSGEKYKLVPWGDGLPGAVYLYQVSGNEPIKLVPADESGSIRRTEYQLSRSGYDAIGGLADGRTYYAVPVPGMPATYHLVDDASEVYSGNHIDLQGSAKGPHLLGFEGVGLLGPTLHEPHPGTNPTIKDGTSIAAVDYDVSLAPHVSTEILWDFENGDLSDTTGTNTFFASPRVNIYWDFENGTLVDTTGKFHFTAYSGSAFTAQPLPYNPTGDNGSVPSNLVGGGNVHINTEYAFNRSENHLSHPGNGPTGLIQSPEIILGENAKISFDWSGVSVFSVYNTANNELLTGIDPDFKNETLEHIEINLSEYAGMKVVFIFNDDKTGSWGHATIDNVHYSADQTAFAEPVQQLGFWGFENQKLTNTRGEYAFAKTGSSSDTAFTHQPITYANSDAGGNNPDIFGKWQLNSYYDWEDGKPKKIGDGPQGRMDTPHFTLAENARFTFHASGAGGGVSLVSASDKTLKTMTVDVQSFTMRPFTFDVSEFAGQDVFLRVFDNKSGSWGHIFIDNIAYLGTPSETTPPQPVTYADTAPSNPDGGVYLVDSYNAARRGGAVTIGDGAIGSARSENFRLGDNASFSFDGSGLGSVRLIDASDGSVLVSKSPDLRSNVMQTYSFDASQYAGRDVYLELLDAINGSWGHLAVDNIRYQSFNNGQDVTYHDSTLGNAGGEYRNDDVDITTNLAGNPVVFDITDGEYLTYSVDIDAAIYDISLLASSTGGGGKMVLSLADGPNGDNPRTLGEVAITDTGSIDQYQEFHIAGVPLPQTTGQVLRIDFVGGTGNWASLDAISFTARPSSQSPYESPVPQIGVGNTLIHAELFDRGGEGIAYHDSTPGNQGGADFRLDQDVDIQDSTDEAVGYNVTDITDGEWLEYTIDIESGLYDIVARASYDGTDMPSITLSLGDGPDGRNLVELGQIEIDSTGSATNWNEFVLSDVLIGADAQGKVLRVEMSGGGFDLNWLQFQHRDPQDYQLVVDLLPPGTVSPTYSIDIDGQSGPTADNWVGLNVTGSSSDANGAKTTVDGVTFEVVGANSSRNRGKPNALLQDEIHDEGSKASVGLAIFGLPQGVYTAEVWVWDQNVNVGKVKIGTTNFDGNDKFYTTSFEANPNKPFVFQFDSSELIDGFGIIVEQNNGGQHARMNALRLTPVSSTGLEAETNGVQQFFAGGVPQQESSGNGPTVKVTGTAGAEYSGQGSKATATSKPKVNVNVGAGSQVTGTDVEITSFSGTRVNSIASGLNIGLLAIGDATANLTIDNTSTIAIGTGATVTATSGDLELKATSTETGTAKTTSSGGGAVKVSISSTNSDISHTTTVGVGDNVTLSAAAGSLQISALDNKEGSASADVNAGGAFVGGNATAHLTVPSSVATTTIGKNATLDAETITLAAKVGIGSSDVLDGQQSSSDPKGLTSNTKIWAYGVAGGGDATSSITVTDNAEIHLMDGATLTSKDSLKLDAAYVNNQMNAQADIHFKGALGGGAAKSNVTANGGLAVAKSGTPVLHNGGSFTHTPQHETGTMTRGGVAHWKIFFVNYTKHASGSAKNNTTSSDAYNSDPSLSGGMTDAVEDSIGTVGQPVNLFFDLADVDVLERHSITIDWGDGRFISQFDVQPEAAIQSPVKSYTYREGGVFPVTVTVTDENGGSDTLTTSAIISGISIVDGALHVVGTTADDTVEIDKVDGLLRVRTSFADEFLLAEDVSSILIATFAGDDRVTVSDHVEVPVVGGSYPASGPVMIESGKGDDLVEIVIDDVLASEPFPLTNLVVTDETGDDVYFINAVDVTIEINDQSGEDWLDFSSMAHGIQLRLDENDGTEQGLGDSGVTLALNGEIENVIGTLFHDRILGSAGDNQLLGLSGNDQLEGAQGDDVLDGGLGADVVLGGADDDLILASAGGDTIVGDSGDDRVILSAAILDPDPLSWIRVDGGADSNVLELAGDVDLTGAHRLVVDNFSRIDLSELEPTSLTLNWESFQRLVPDFRTLHVNGGDGDRLAFADAEMWLMGEPNISGDQFRRTVIDQERTSQGLLVDLPLPWQNLVQVTDVNNSQQVTPLDALVIINELTWRRYSDPVTSELVDPLSVDVWPNHYYDVSGDGRVTPLDALRVINDLARQAAVTVPGPSGELVDFAIGDVADMLAEQAHVDQLPRSARSSLVAWPTTDSVTMPIAYGTLESTEASESRDEDRDLTEAIELLAHDIGVI